MGKGTFTVAGGGLVDTAASAPGVDTYIALNYAHVFTVWRNSEGRYGLYDDGVKVNAGYDDRTRS